MTSTVTCTGDREQNTTHTISVLVVLNSGRWGAAGRTITAQTDKQLHVRISAMKDTDRMR